MLPAREKKIREQEFFFGDCKGSHITWWEQERLELLAYIDWLRAHHPTTAQPAHSGQPGAAAGGAEEA